MSEKPTVCLILEGSYPYITGGVSAWVHQLILYLKDIDFVLYTISPAKDQPRRYELPSNVVGHKEMVLSAPARSTAVRCSGTARSGVGAGTSTVSSATARSKSVA